MNSPTSYILKKIECSLQTETAAIQSICTAAANRKRQPFFVQVGANDGTSDDPLHRILLENNHWSGVFIEPLPSAFEKLQHNYKNFDGDYRFCNVAIGIENGNGTLYHVKPEFIEERVAKSSDKIRWLERIASLKKEHLENFDCINLKERILEQEVEVQTLQRFIRQNDIQKIDALFIDTEGYDWIILRQLDLEQFSPLVIMYEHRHILPGAREKAEQFLLERGYELRVFAYDTVATLPLTR